MMCGVRDSPHHDPCAGAKNREEIYLFFPPRVVPASKACKAFARILGIAMNEGCPCFSCWKRRRSHIDTEHVLEPTVLTHTLMNHVFANASAALVGRMGTCSEVVVEETIPNGEDLQNFGFVGIDEELIAGDHEFVFLWCRRGLDRATPDSRKNQLGLNLP